MQKIKKYCASMMIAIAGLMIGMGATAAPYDVVITQQNSIGSGTMARLAPTPANIGPCMLRIQDNALRTPDCVWLGAGLSWDGKFIKATGMPGIQGPTGERGYDGPEGLSAYQMYVQRTGYAGSVDEWLEMVVKTGEKGDKGDKGDKGEPGMSVFDTVKIYGGYMGNIDDWQLSLRGPAGPAGADGAQGAQGVPGTPAPIFNYGDPVTRTLAVSTSYSALDATKPAALTLSLTCRNQSTLLAASACTAQVRQGGPGLTCSTGTVVATVSSTYAMGLALDNTSTTPVAVRLGTGKQFAVCPSAGTFTVTAIEQTAG